MNLRRLVLVVMAATALLGPALGLAGCSGGSSGSVQTGSQSNQPAQTGTVEVFLSDPTHHFTPDNLKQVLRFVGLDEDNRVSYAPVDRPFSEVQVLEQVPVTTVTLLAFDPDDPSVYGEAPVQVDPDGINYVTDMVLLPDDNPPLLDVTSARGEGAAARQVGAGFIQEALSTRGNKNANSRMAGREAMSYTSSLAFPYRTNTWLSPLFVADNKRKVFLGQQTYQNNAPITIFQKQVYPHPWSLFYNVRPELGQLGLRLSLERPRITQSTFVPTPDNKGVTGKGYADVNGNLDITNIQLDPGFLSYAIKVHRQGDFDGELLMRALDDEKFKPGNGLDKDSALKVGVVRGNPFLYFTAYNLPKVKFNNFFADGNTTNDSGTLTVGGKEINYTVITGNYDPSLRRLAFVLFYPKATASYTPQPGIASEIVFTGRDDAATKANFFVLCTLGQPPAGQASPFADATTLNKLAAAAFSYPTNTEVTYSYNQATQTADAVYNTAATNVLGGTVKTITGLMPHHYLPSPVHNNDPILQNNPPALTNGAAAAMEFTTVRGTMRVYDANPITCRYPFPGMLPWMPPLDAGDATGRAELHKWVQDVYKVSKGSENPPYTAFKQGVGQDAYIMNKFIGRNAVAHSPILDTDGDTAMAADVLARNKEAIELYFKQTPQFPQSVDQGQAPYYFYYDPRVATLNQYPGTAAASSTAGGLGGNTDFPMDPDPDRPGQNPGAPYDGFGTISRLNDHHFHYGYMIYAAGQIALRDPAWGTAWKDTINQLVFDCANNATINPNPVFKFAKERHWDPYMNHGYAAGFTFADENGNNEESVSEQINFWAGVIQWAAATGQTAMMNQAAAHYAAAIHTSWIHWFDPSGHYNALVQQLSPGTPTNWPTNGSTRLFDGATVYSNFFRNHPIAQRGISLFPMTPATFYHAMNPTAALQILSDLDAFLTANDIDPFHPNGLADWRTTANQWLDNMNFYGCFAKYAAMVDPANALNRYYKDATPDQTVIGGIKPWDKLTDPGDSGVFVYFFTRYIQTHGKPDLWRKATNTPFFMVFEDTANAKRTYVGFNHTASFMNITFADGTTITNVAPRSAKALTVNVP